jgi:transcriptional regulator with XRE-family HTH domain
MEIERDTVTAVRLGERIQRMREAGGLGPIRVAESMGIQPDELMRWESGAVIPPMIALLELAQVLGCTYDDLVR